MMAVLWEQIDRDVKWSILHFGKSVELFSKIPRDEDIDPDYADTMHSCMPCSLDTRPSKAR
ncbi:MAG TPA: hypothetical protein VH414_16455 [Lichenihabitans sp.]|jgi:hypothetical protein|nr:hypothetical protein [Lichenihabitans sp.]